LFLLFSLFFSFSLFSLSFPLFSLSFSHLFSIYLWDPWHLIMRSTISMRSIDILDLIDIMDLIDIVDLIIRCHGSHR
jgi:hypothetical protein